MRIKKLLGFLSISVLLFACSETKDTSNRELLPDPEGLKKDSLIISPESSVKEEHLLGYYVGDFEASKINDASTAKQTNKINISIDSIAGEKVYGHSVIAGNIRPFSGSIKQLNDSIYHMEVKEPGNNQYDGTFNFNLETKRQQLRGTWVANNKKLPVSERTFHVTYRTFKYDPSLEVEKQHVEVYGTDEMNSVEAITEDAGKFNASVIVLKSKDIENMYQRDLEVTRNAIYARHGYSFRNRDMRHFFDNISWYIPVSVNVTKDLTELEKKNIELLKRYEKHAEKYYDEYGR